MAALDDMLAARAGAAPDAPTGLDALLTQRAAGQDLAAPAVPPQSYLDTVKANVLGSGHAFNELLMGGLRGAAGIGTTLVRPFESKQANDERKAAISGFMQDNTSPDSAAFGYGRLGAEVAGTAGVGGVLGAGAKVLGASAPIVNALSSAGFTAGKAAPGLGGWAANMATRTGAGSLTGGASAALVDPDNAGAGAVIGAALPPAIAVLGKAGGGVADAWRRMVGSGDLAGAQALLKSLDVSTPAGRDALIAQLRGAQTLVPGASPTVAQALQSPEASILQRVVYDSPGGGALRQKIADQGAARLTALEGVAPTVASGPAMAREDLGQTVAGQVIPARAAEKARISGLYDNVDPEDLVRLQLPLEDLQAAKDRFLGAGTFGQGGGANAALKTANQIGLDVTPTQITKAQPLTGGRVTGDDMTLGAAVRKVGIDPDELRGMSGFPGEVRAMKESNFGKNLVNKNGQPLDRIAEKMWERGYLENADAGELIEKLSAEASGYPTFSRNADPAILFGKARDANMPERFVTPGTSTPVALNWQTLQNFRSSLGDAANVAAANAPKDSAALSAMRSAIGARVDAAGGQGLLREGESFPTDAYARWTDANAAHAAMKAQYDTGPLAGIFRTGPNGEPALQGGEIASRAWGARPGMADDVKSFKRLVGDNPSLMGQFKSMVTTEGAGTADAAGNLTTKYSKWVSQTLPGLKEAFSPSEVGTLQRIAQDIDRHASAVKLGTSLGGSNTYQNASNALKLGLLDHPFVTKGVGSIPGVKGAIDGFRDSARTSKASTLAGLLSDSGGAADALQMLKDPREVNGLLGMFGPAALKALPVAGSR